MRRAYYDFCLNKAVIESNHPHLFDLKFCLIQVTQQDLKQNFELPKNLKWNIRAASPNSEGLKERWYPNYLLTTNGYVKIVRPKIGTNVLKNDSEWLEVTPEMISAAYKSRSGLIWLKRTIKQFGIDRIVLSSVLERPPSMRDLLSALALILDWPFDRTVSNIKHNSQTLVDELYEV